MVRPPKKHSMVMVQLCQNHWKTIDGNGGLKKPINHSIALKNWPSLWSTHNPHHHLHHLLNQHQCHQHSWECLWLAARDCFFSSSCLYRMIIIPTHHKDDDHDQNIVITTTMMTESCQERYRFLSAVCPCRPSIQGNIGAAVNMNREAREYKSKHDYTKKSKGANKQRNKQQLWCL